MPQPKVPSVRKNKLTMLTNDKLQSVSGMLDVKFKGSAFATWTTVFVRLDGRWLTIHKRERDPTRIAAVELGRGVGITDLTVAKQFNLFCNGGLLPRAEMSFRAKSPNDRDLWVLAISTNARILSDEGLDPLYGVKDLQRAITKLQEGLQWHSLRIRHDLTVRCATGQSIVTFLISQALATDREQAVGIARRLHSMNIIHHVVWAKDFVDSGESYAFFNDGDDTDNDYEEEHFCKYVDSRKFWKYFDAGDEISSSISYGGMTSATARTDSSP